MIQKTLSPDPKRRMETLADLVHDIEDLPCGRTYKVTVEQVRKGRSDAQNRYLWGVAYKLLSDDTGYEMDDLHTYLLGRFFGTKLKRVPKSKYNREGLIEVPMRTTTTNENGKRSVLSWKEFSDYVEFIKRFASMRAGVVIPDPDPSWFEKPVDTVRCGKARLG